ncbi:MAG: bifunctional riboflavin kinase/FAD synthetase, partial [Bacteroidota bacterium]
MMVHNDLKQLPEFKNAVITIGSFDGVHCGHQKIIQRVNQLAQKVDGESVLITFHPHPRLVIYPKDDSLQLITTIDEKVRLLERYGLDHVVVVPFSIEFSQQSADEYIVNFLVDRFRPKYIVIGYDHKFGLNRQGDIDFLKHYQEAYDYQVEEIPVQEINDLSISSTKIRKAVQKGEIAAANELLGHYYTLTGTVVHGQQIGITLGFPTANLEVNHPHKLIPPNGIYAVRVKHHDQTYGGMLYIGDRPSLKDLNNQTIEVNIFEFEKNIYGDRLLVEFVAYVRSDITFSNLADLSVQLGKDKIASQAILQKQVLQKSTQNKEVDPSVAVVILN